MVLDSKAPRGDESFSSRGPIAIRLQDERIPRSEGGTGRRVAIGFVGLLPSLGLAYIVKEGELTNEFTTVVRLYECVYLVSLARLAVDGVETCTHTVLYFVRTSRQPP